MLVSLPPLLLFAVSGSHASAYASLQDTKEMTSDMLSKASLRGPRIFVLLRIWCSLLAAMHPAIADTADLDTLAISQRVMAFATYSDCSRLTHVVAVVPLRQDVQKFVYRNGDISLGLGAYIFI